MSKYYLTTSIAYINGEPHIGYAQELLAADVVARYHREIKGDETYFLTGSDEHGASVQVNAEKAGMAPRDFVESLIGKFKGLKDDLEISYDYFIRTSSEEHQKNAQEIWNKVLKNGYLEKRKYSGLYCVGCEAMINKKDLVGGKCPNHPNLEPEVIEEENWFFKLSSFRDKLLDLYKRNPNFVKPEFRFNEIKSLVEKGLEDVSVSRPKEKLSWGIEVPNDKEHVMYVWFDALTNYLYPSKWWPANLHIIGKDILRFHAALWPAMLMAAGFSEEELPKSIYVHGFISVEGQKMSKTLGNVVAPKDLIEKFGVEATRYLMLKELNFGEDSDFSWERFTKRYNADLANDLGNLLQRTIVMANRFAITKSQISKFKSQNDNIKFKIYKKIEELKFGEALDLIWGIIREANKYINDEKPWELAKSDREKLELVLNKLLNDLESVAEVIKPFLPETSEEIIRQLETREPKPLFLKIN